MSKSINSNKQFMIGNGILAFGVFFIVCLFLYLGFRYQDKGKTYQGTYVITLDRSLSGDSLTVNLNDSLLFHGIPDTAVTLHIKRFAEESLLMVARPQTDGMSLLNLNPQGSTIVISQRQGQICFTEQ